MHAIRWSTRVIAGAAIAVLAGSAAVGAVSSKPAETTFSLFPQTSLLNCLKPSPDAPTPEVTVTAKRGDLNDRARIHLKGFKPNLGFDLFTIQHSPQTATGTPDANPSVGLAWYQTDLQVGAD